MVYFKTLISVYKQYSNMPRRIKCPECESTEIEEVTIEDDVGGKSHIYPEVTCENGHSFGLELEVATILR